MNKKPFLKFGIAILIVAVMGLFIYKVIKINEKYPPAYRNDISMKEDFKLNELEYIVNCANLYELEHFAEITDCRKTKWYQDTLSYQYETYILTATITVQNTTNIERQFHIEEIMLASGAFQNGIDIALLEILNGNQKLLVTLAPKQSTTFTVGYNLFDAQFSAKSWDEILERPFDLVFSLYPEKNIVALKITFEETTFQQKT